MPWMQRDLRHNAVSKVCSFVKLIKNNQPNHCKFTLEYAHTSTQAQLNPIARTKSVVEEKPQKHPLKWCKLENFGTFVTLLSNSEKFRHLSALHQVRVNCSLNSIYTYHVALPEKFEL